MRLIAALTPRAPFQRLIVSEQKSLGREMFATGHYIKELAEAGVEIIEYGEGRSLTPKNYMDKMQFMFRSSADEAAREDASKRQHEAHAHHHQAGHVVGGRVFGYANRPVKRHDRDGNPLRSHTDRVINPVEAAVVIRIFTLFAAGWGYKRIAKLLTAEVYRTTSFQAQG